MTAIDPARFAFPCGEDAEGDETLRRTLGLPPLATPGPEHEFVLERLGGRLQLTWRGQDPPLRIGVDPDTGALAHRLRTAHRTQPLPRAVGLHRRRPSVIDATAGLGRDALLLASLGATVTAVERHPVLAALLRDALARTGRAELVRVVVAEAAAWLRALEQEGCPDVVYLDPMYPALAGSSRVKKEMQVCRALLGQGGDDGDLFAAAREAARDRVVVKRHPQQPELAAEPSHTVRGARVRYDVYLVSR